MQLNTKRFILVGVMLVLCLAVLASAIPQRLNYQAVLKNKTTGRILPDGNYTMTFRLYTASTGGSALWAETATATITNGVLTHPLGSVTTLNLAFDQNYYLGIQVSGDSEMSPRERLTSVGYAYTADNAVSAITATTLQGSVPGDFGDITQVHAGDGLRGGGSYGAVTVQVNAGGGLSTSNDTVVLASTYQSGSAYDSRFLNADGDIWTGGLYGMRSSSYYVLQLINNGIGYAMYARNSSHVPTVNAVQYGTGRAFSGSNYADSGTGVGGLSYGLNGIGVYGEAAGGIGVYGYSTITAAVYARNAGTGSAIFAKNSSSWATLEAQNDYYGPAIYAHSKSGYGLYATTDASNNAIYAYNSTAVGGTTIYGYNRGSWRAILGAKYGSADIEAVGGYNYGSLGNGVYGYTTSTTYGVYGENDSSGIGVFGKSVNGIGVKAYSANDYALYALSTGYRGAFIRGDTTAGWFSLYVDSGGSSKPGAYVNGTLYVTGSKTGFVVDLCKNSGTGTLEVGDIVVIQGSSPAVLGEIPVMLVAKTNTAYNTAVVGIVNRGITIGSGEPAAALGVGTAEKEMIVESSATSVIEPSQYVSVVTLGAYKAIKVDASYGAILPGDLLTTSLSSGYAMKVQPEYINGKPFYPSGCIIGKALGSLESGQGTIPVFISHQ